MRPDQFRPRNALTRSHSFLCKLDYVLLCVYGWVDAGSSPFDRTIIPPSGVFGDSHKYCCFDA